MADIVNLYTQHQNLSDDEQKKAGEAIPGSMPAQHKEFIRLLTELVKSGKIDVLQPETFLNKAIYDALPEAGRGQVDLATVNIAGLLRQAVDFFVSKETPDESPHLQTMIEQLWTMKERVEQDHGDVYKF